MGEGGYPPPPAAASVETKRFASRELLPFHISFWSPATI